MNPHYTFRYLATPGILLGAIAVLIFMITLSSARADRLDDFKKLKAEYDEAYKKYSEARSSSEKPTPAENIRRAESWPAWKYLPGFVALAEANPADEAAYECCQWVFERTHNAGTSDRELFAADQKVWQIIAAHHAKGDKVHRLCLEAVQYLGPERENFLRGLLKQENLSKQHAGFATLALAEVLINKCDYLESTQRDKKPPPNDKFTKYILSRRAPEFLTYVTAVDAATLKDESKRLLRVVLERYSDVPLTISMPQFRSWDTLGKKAEQSLYALEHLSVGAEAPDIVGTDLDGKPLKLKDYRGRVVLLSFWFTGCGPCMAMIPTEQKLVETFKDLPFALLGICGDSDLAEAQKTAKEENINWPCWFDGSTHGPITSQYNVMGWPTFYLIDQNGRIAIKDMDRDDMEAEINELLNKKE